MLRQLNKDKYYQKLNNDSKKIKIGGRKMKKLLALLVTLAMITTLAACGGITSTDTNGNTNTGEDTSSKEPKENNSNEGNETYTIGYSFPTINNEFWGTALSHVQASSEALGFELVYDDCNNDQAEQLNDVESMISSGIDGLVLGPQDASVVAGILDACKKNDVKVVIIDRWPGDDLVAGEDYTAFIGPNDEEAGYQIAMSLINAGSKKIIGIGGYQNTSVAEGRRAGLVKALEENPDVELLQYEWAGENWDDGDEYFRNMYQANPDLDGVWCYNDSLALASVNVCKELGIIDKVKVGGMDLLSPAVESMQANELWFSTGGHYMQAAFGAVIVFDELNGNKYTGDPVVSLDLLNVSQDNLGKFVEKYIDNEEPVVWKDLSKTYNPDAELIFELSLD